MPFDFAAQFPTLGWWRAKGRSPHHGGERPREQPLAAQLGNFGLGLPSRTRSGHGEANKGKRSGSIARRGERTLLREGSQVEMLNATSGLALCEGAGRGHAGRAGCCDPLSCRPTGCRPAGDGQEGPQPRHRGRLRKPGPGVPGFEEAFPEDPVVAEEDSGELRQAAHAESRAKVLRFVTELRDGVDEETVCRWIDRGGAQGARGDRFWTLDPIDGTKGFLRGEQYAIALALIVGGQIEVAAMACPTLSPRPRRMGPPRWASLLVAVRGQGRASSARWRGPPAFLSE